MKIVGAISATDIISIIRSEIENYDWDMESRETGKVIWVGDGIATIYGIDHAMYGEIIVFENGVKGMVQDIRENEIGCILFGKDTGIKEGTKVTRTKKRAGIPVGDFRLGAGNHQVDISSLAKGVYVLRAADGVNSRTLKFAK